MLKEKREKENYDKTPGNFFEIKMETRKTANKTGDSVTITSVNESLIEIKEFSKDRFFGCEFVKAVTGFQCRLCNLHLKDAAAVIPHVDGRVHRNNYQVHLKKNKDYEKVQTEQNKELIEVLTQYEDTDVLLFETTKAKEMKFLAKLDENIVWDEKLLNPPEKRPKVEEKKDKDEEKTDEDKEAADGDEKAEDDEENKEDDEEATEEDQEANEGEEEEEEEASEEVNGEEEVEEEAEVEAEEEEAEAEEAEAEAEEEENDAEEKAEEEEEEKKEEVEAEKKKPAAKKPAAAKTKTTPPVKTTTPGKTTAPAKTTTSAKRGRGRGGKAGTTRARRSKGKDDAASEEKEESNDSSFMDAFQVVDEVVED